MGNGVSGKPSANHKTIYLEVNGQKQKVSGFFFSAILASSICLRWAAGNFYFFFFALLIFIFARLDLIALETVPAPEILSHLNNLRAAGCCFINVFIKHLKSPIDQFHKLFIFIDLS